MLLKQKLKFLETAKRLASLTRNTKKESRYRTFYKHVAYPDANCKVAKTHENVKQAWQTHATGATREGISAQYGYENDVMTQSVYLKQCFEIGLFRA